MKRFCPPPPLWEVFKLVWLPISHVYPFFIPKIMSYNISFSAIDHYKMAVARSSLLPNHPNARWIFDEDRHARNLLCLLSSIMVNKALQLDDEVEGMLLTGRKTIHFPNPLGMRYLDGKHSGSQQIASFQTTFY